MKILLDECLPRKLKFEIAGHEVATVPEMGWAGTKNGDLLRLAAAHFDVFVTADQNLGFQQNLLAAPLPVVVLVARDSRFATLRPLMPEVVQALQSIQPGQILRVGH